ESVRQCAGRTRFIIELRVNKTVGSRFKGCKLLSDQRQWIQEVDIRISYTKAHHPLVTKIDLVNKRHVRFVNVTATPEIRVGKEADRRKGNRPLMFWEDPVSDIREVLQESDPVHLTTDWIKLIQARRKTEIIHVILLQVQKVCIEIPFLYVVCQSKVHVLILVGDILPERFVITADDVPSLIFRQPFKLEASGSIK